ncbi:hypothetical protein, partial [Stutzerimonas kirkiae]|uniref:hypothetical protein n=1 Tax=Stutzerimonas kirkiae TaxID=2211392 RepID=UPI001A954D87
RIRSEKNIQAKMHRPLPSLDGRGALQRVRERQARRKVLATQGKTLHEKRGKKWAAGLRKQ